MQPQDDLVAEGGCHIGKFTGILSNIPYIGQIYSYLVASYTGERRALASVRNSLASVYKLRVKEGLITGIGFGVVISILFYKYALAVLFGAKMILEKGYTGGDVFSVILSVFFGST